MDDFSLYQWLVLGLLSVIAICAFWVAIGLYHSLEVMTQRLEGPLKDVRRELERLRRSDYDVL